MEVLTIEVLELFLSDNKWRHKEEESLQKINGGVVNKKEKEELKERLNQIEMGIRRLN